MSDLMALLLDNQGNTVGDAYNREWTYNITDYALGGIAYQSDDIVPNLFAEAGIQF